MTETDDCLNGLTALIDANFPKTCAVCGTTYQTATQFLTMTQNMPSGRSSLKEALEENGSTVVEVFRNCACGSTLMDEFNSRRDDSNVGQKHRVKFDQLLIILQNQNIPIEIARTEILKLFNGKKSETLDYLLTKTIQPKTL